MWNSFATDGRAGVHAEITTYPGANGDAIHAYVAKPVGDGPFPGILLVHHIPGWDEFYQETAERLARHGYLVICPDWYCRIGHGTPDDVTAKARAIGGMTDDSVVADSEAALKWLKAQPNCTGKVGVIGSCSGGRHAVLIASRVQGFSAVVDCWGGVVTGEGPAALSPARPVAPIDYTESLNAPLLGLFGNDDTSPTPEQVNIHEARLKKAGKEYEFHRYDGAGHAFMYYFRPAYRPEQAMDGWAKIFTFFNDKLR